MSKYKNLIETLCPDGVEWKPLENLMGKEIVVITPSIKIKRNDYAQTGKTPIVSQELEFISGYCDLVDPRIMQGEYICYGDHSEHIKYVDFPFVQGADGLKILKLNCDYVSLRYIYHALQNNYVRQNNYQRHFKCLIETQIPLPPLEVQKEIVRILDTFTDLERELEKELELRLKQYSYYRDKLLTFGDDVERKKLGEIGTFTRGNGLQKKDFTDSGFPCIHYGQIYTYYGNFTNKTKSFVSEECAKKLRKAKKGDLIIATTSENVEDVCKCLVWLGEEEVCYGGHSCCFSHNQNPKYIAYFFQTMDFFAQKKKVAKGTKVIEIKNSDLEKIEIPLPSLAEQKRIADILDRFSELTGSLTSGLPAEIAARKKQYEYYREKLLTFQRK